MFYVRTDETATGRMNPAPLARLDAVWPSSILVPTRATPRRGLDQSGATEADPCPELARWLQLRMRLLLQHHPSCCPITSWLVQAHLSLTVINQMFHSHRLMFVAVGVPRDTLSIRFSSEAVGFTYHQW